MVVGKEVTIIGAGAEDTLIVATNGNKTLTFASNGATVSGFTITHEYTAEELSEWSFNNNGVIFLNMCAGNTLRDCVVTMNRNGIYLNNCQNNSIIDNMIVNNRTGINMTNNINGTEIYGNTIADNWTVGLVFYCLDAGILFRRIYQLSLEENIFDGNWYSEILLRMQLNVQAL